MFSDRSLGLRSHLGFGRSMGGTRIATIASHAYVFPVARESVKRMARSARGAVLGCVGVGCFIVVTAGKGTGWHIPLDGALHF